ncbi:MAG: DNA mismatch repair protein MutH, partial [Thaumarchaeota archaeon]|nr:DNA mismatch repair protein MutH [Nitrososphaerota archaeon]
MEAVEDFKQDEVANIPNSLLISAAYNGKTKKVILKFYNPESEKIYLWEDKTGHQPYCFSKMAPEDLGFLSERDDVVEIKTVKKIDTLKDKEIEVSKIIVTDPLAIGGTQTTQSIRNVVEAWESDIKYYETYLYDNSLIIGKYYRIENDKIIPHDFEMSDETDLTMKTMLFDKLGNTGMIDTNQFQEEVSNWAELLDQPVPKIKRMSLDIEVETDGKVFPDVKIADKKVTAVGFEASDGMKRVFVLRRDGIEEGVNDLDKNIEVIFYEKDQEKKLIEDAFGLVKKYPVLITYNGDQFDLLYLYNRAKRLGISDEINPLYMMRDSATLT